MKINHVTWRKVEVKDDTGEALAVVLRTPILTRTEPHPFIPSIEAPDRYFKCGETETRCFMYAFVDITPAVKVPTSPDEAPAYTPPTTRLWVCGDWIIAPLDIMGSVTAAMITYDNVNDVLDEITRVLEDASNFCELGASDAGFAQLPTSLMPSIRKFLETHKLDLKYFVI